MTDRIVTDCRDCPAHWTNTEYPESACQLGPGVSFGFGGHHSAIMDSRAPREVPTDCPLRAGPVTIRLR